MYSSTDWEEGNLVSYSEAKLELPNMNRSRHPGEQEIMNDNWELEACSFSEVLTREVMEPI